MKELPETRESLILQIRSKENRLAWEEFVEIYRPVVYGVAASRGLQHEDCLDLVQSVFVSVANSISNFEKLDRGKTRFRNWLLRIAKNATINLLTRRPPDIAVGGSGCKQELIGQASFDPPDEREIEFEYQRQLYTRAAERVRRNTTEESWLAFELTAIQGLPIEQVANELGKSVGSIYALRSRIMKQLSAIVSQLEESYE
ncbi:MAG: sigma-70 family RNA polymerase sigma factor [Planctomycetota bacterium]